jgi:hypothetical protein
MADEHHLEILMRGVASWNQWREENPDVTPDLSDVSITGDDSLFAERNRASLDQPPNPEPDELRPPLRAGSSSASASIGQTWLVSICTTPTCGMSSSRRRTWQKRTSRTRTSPDPIWTARTSRIRT